MSFSPCSLMINGTLNLNVTKEKQNIWVMYLKPILYSLCIWSHNRSRQITVKSVKCWKYHQMVTMRNPLKEYRDYLKPRRLSHCGYLRCRLWLPLSMMNADTANKTSQGMLTKTNVWQMFFCSVPSVCGRKITSEIQNVLSELMANKLYKW